MAKKHTKIYVEEDVWNAAESLWTRAGMNNTVALERILQFYAQAPTELRLIINGQHETGQIGRTLLLQLAETIDDTSKQQMTEGRPADGAGGPLKIPVANDLIPPGAKTAAYRSTERESPGRMRRPVDPEAEANRKNKKKP